MVKPVDSRSIHRPLKIASEGRVIQLEATILRSGHTTSTIKIGPLEVRIGNAALREATGDPDL